jgi:hypothetical protein
VLDFQPSLLALFLCTAPVLLWASRARAVGPRLLAIAALAATFAGWLALGTEPDRFDVVYGGAWIVSCLLALAVRPWFARVTDWVTAVVVAYAVLQAATPVYDRLPVFAPDRDARTIAEGNVFHWCENTDRGLLYATHTSCDVWSMARCCRRLHRGARPARTATRPTPALFRRHLLRPHVAPALACPIACRSGWPPPSSSAGCVPGNVMEFSFDDPTRVTRDVLGDASDDGTGAIFLFDRARNAGSTSARASNRVLRVDLATGAALDRAAIDPELASTATGAAASS